ncbi:glycosyltransferase family 2 protein [Marinobacter sp. chi1]|uniref:Glycosyltransferase family 2 protein n=1 Tax=Marinobacter suaedae TaxID=3057675 RepID=A0ABT8W4N9_9GAMM|nr:glycosyltransferase family 2 protein [Marinobacter sp. chi1]MDO3723209.1 glycosyltransferase family 2 protein [Marinobacter sp. chi1]
MNPLVSILIPVYNVAPYLREALDSIVNQSYENLEIIIINDGSTDNSLEIAEEYERDARVSIFSQPNRGLSGARNKGVELATGKYIYYFDSDDILELNAIEDCVKVMEESDLDIIAFSASTFGDIDFKGKTYHRENTDIMTGKAFLEKYIATPSYFCSACNYLCKKTVVTNNCITFIDRIPHEDETYTFDIFYHAGRVKSISSRYFKRRYRAGSIMTSRKSERNAIALLKVHRHFVEHYSDFAPGRYQIKKFTRRISQVIMKNNLPYSVMHGFDFSIPLRYRVKYAPKRFISALFNLKG